MADERPKTEETTKQEPAQEAQPASQPKADANAADGPQQGQIGDL